MKNIIFLVLVICAASQAHIMMEVFGEVHEYKEACLAELGIEITHPPPPADGATKPPRQEPNHDMKCLINCLFMKKGILNNSGVLQPNKVNIPTSASNLDLVKCTTITNSDPCEQAYLVESCILDQLPQQS
uniref:OBP11 n=1 Tax=Holotrichia parallela TaxID=93412 RepID=A0A0G2YIT5_HOLPA|nr:OBP11 [Holotrichia parallela]